MVKLIHTVKTLTWHYDCIFYSPRFPAGTVAPVFDEAFCLLFGARLSGHSCSAIITALDVVFSFSCLVAIVGGTRRAREYIQEAQRKIVSTSDYTVFVRNLPSSEIATLLCPCFALVLVSPLVRFCRLLRVGTTEAEVRLHFESLFRLDVDDEFNERHGLFASCCRRGKGKAKAKPIHPPPSPTHRPLLESPASSPGKHSRSSAKVYAIDGVGSAQDQLEQANAPLVIRY